jgi:hypothetical protein
VAPALVGSPSSYTGGNTSQTTITCTLAQATTAGSILVATIAMGATATPSTTVSTVTGGGTWAKVSADNPATRKDSSEIWWTAPTAGTTSVVITPAATCGIAGHVYEFSGCNTSSPFDQGSGTDGSSTAATTPSATTTLANEALVAVINQGVSTVTVSGGTAGWTGAAQQIAHPTSATAGENSAYQIVSSTGTYTYALTLSATAVWSGCIATFKAAGSTSYTASPAETLTLTDSPARQLTALRSGTEALTITDSTARLLTALRSSAETLTALVDAITRKRCDGLVSVQDVVRVSPTASETSTSSASPLTITASTAGNLLVLSVLFNAATTASVSAVFDNAGQSWPNKVDITSGALSCGIWAAYNCLPGTTTITVNFSAGVADVIRLQEWSGAQFYADPFDQSASNTGSTTTPNTGTTGTTAQDSELVVGVYGFTYTGTAPTQGGFPAGFTNDTAAATAFGSGTQLTEQHGYQAAKSTGTFNYSTTLSGSAPWIGAIATFRASSTVRRTLAEVWSTTDAVTAGRAYLRALAEALTTSDVPARALRAVRLAAETVSTSDAVSRAYASARAAAEALTLTDTAARAFSAARAATEAISLTDALARALSAGRAPVEAVVTADAVVRLLTATRAAAEALAMSDAAARLAVLGRSTAETVGPITDAVQKGVSKAVGEALSTADTAVRGLVAQRSPAEALPAITDVVGRALGAIRAAAEATATSDAVSRLGTYLRSTVEGLSLTDVIVAVKAGAHTYVASIAESLTTSDTAARVWSGARAAAEALSVSDAVSRLAGFPRALVEVLTTSDTAVRWLAALRSPSEAMTLTDVVGRAWTGVRAAVETLATSDAVTRTLGALRAAVETVAVSDAAGRRLTAARTAAEAVVTSDLAGRALAAMRAAVDAAFTADALARAAGFLRGTAEALTTSDVVSRMGTFGRSVADTLGTLIDAVAAVLRRFVAGKAHTAITDGTLVGITVTEQPYILAAISEQSMVGITVTEAA